MDKIDLLDERDRLELDGLLSNRALLKEDRLKRATYWTLIAKAKQKLADTVCGDTLGLCVDGDGYLVDYDQ